MSPAGQRRPAGGPGGESAGSQGGARGCVWGAALLVLLIFLVYQPAWRAGFIWDDDAHLTAHPCIVGPLGFKEIWTTSEANYFPLVLTVFWVLNNIFGLNPVVFHLVGIALHAAAALLLWAVLRRLGVRGAAIGAALWALHPVAVESVAWVSEIINTQSCVFFLLSIRFAARWLKPGDHAAPRPADYALACLMGLCAILSKPSTVMLPVVLALCAWWLRGQLRWRDAVWLAPFFVLALLASGWTIWEQKVHQGAAGPDWNQSLGERLVIAGRVPWFYLGKLLWPHPLSFIYPRWTLDSGRVLSYLLLLAAIVAGALLWRRRDRALRPLFFAGAFFAAMLFPVLGFFSVYFYRFSFVADHFQYLASIGPLALLGAGAGTLAQAGTRGPGPWVMRSGVGLVLVVLAAMSWRQAGHYRDDETLWRATLRTNPGTILAHNNLGVALMSAGKHAEAIPHFERVLATDATLAEPHFNVGKSLLALPGRRTEAGPHFEAYLRAKPESAEAHLALAGVLASDPARRAEAIAHYERALRGAPDNAEAHANLGLMLGGMPERLDDALRHGEISVRLKPAVAEAHLNFAINLARRPDRLTDAVRHYEEALRLKPDYLKAHINLGLLLAATPARRPDALQHYRAALALDPSSAITHNNLGIVLAQGGQIDEAIAHFEQAVQIDPGYAAARNNLAQLKNSRPSPP